MTGYYLSKLSSKKKKKRILIRIQESYGEHLYKKKPEVAVSISPWLQEQVYRGEKRSPSERVTNVQSNPRHNPVSLPKFLLLCHFYHLVRLKLYLRLEFGPPQLHHEEKIFKERCFAILMFGMSDKICNATNWLPRCQFNDIHCICQDRITGRLYVY